MIIDLAYHDLIAYAMSGRGKMRIKQIYKRVHEEARYQRWPLSKHWQATVRNTLQRHSKQTKKYTPPYLFVHHDRNLWECRK